MFKILVGHLTKYFVGHMILPPTNMAKKIHCLTDEKGWHSDDDDENDWDKKNLDGQTLNVQMPFHAMNWGQITISVQPMCEQFGSKIK